MKSRKLQLVIGILLSVCFLWLAFRKVDLSTLWQTLRGINYWWTVPFMVLTIMGMYARALRWHYLLLPKYHISGHRLFSPLIIGFAFNGIFPARAGEFARAYVLGKKDKVPFLTGLATVLVERIIDGLVIVVGFAIALALMPEFDPSISFTYDNRTQLSGQTILIIINALLAIIFVLSLFVLFTIGQGLKRKGLNQARLEQRGDPDPSGLVPANSPANPGFATNLMTKLEKLGNIKRVRTVFVCLLLMAIIILGLINLVPPLDLGKVYILGKVYKIDGASLQAITKKTLIVILALLVILVFLLIGKTRQLAQTIVLGVPLLPQGLKRSLASLLDSFSLGLHSLRNIRALLPIIVYSIIAWVMVVFSLLLMSWGFKGLEINFAQATAIMVIICVAISVPSAPGYWGLYEFGVLLSLQILGISQDTAVGMGYSLVIHTFQLIPIISIGLFYACREHISLKQISEARESEPSPAMQRI